MNCKSKVTQIKKIFLVNIADFELEFVLELESFSTKNLQVSIEFSKLDPRIELVDTNLTILYKAGKRLKYLHHLNRIDEMIKTFNIISDI